MSLMRHHLSTLVLSKTNLGAFIWHYCSTNRNENVVKILTKNAKYLFPYKAIQKSKYAGKPRILFTQSDKIRRAFIFY